MILNYVETSFLIILLIASKMLYLDSINILMYNKMVNSIPLFLWNLGLEKLYVKDNMQANMNRAFLNIITTDSLIKNCIKCCS